MALAAILETVGVPGSIAILVAALLAFYHFRHGITILSKISTVAQIGAVFGVVLVAAAAGLIPGIDLAIALDRLGGFLSTVVNELRAIVEVILS